MVIVIFGGKEMFRGVRFGGKLGKVIVKGWEGVSLFFILCGFIYKSCFDCLVIMLKGFKGVFFFWF